jgi:predicted nucleic acid-binding Zn ribbon protein
MSNNNQMSLGDAIKQMLKKYNLDQKVTVTEIYQSWEKIMGPSINKHTQSIELREKILVIRLDSSAMRHELSFARPKIVEKINEHIGYHFIDDVLLM